MANYNFDYAATEEAANLLIQSNSRIKEQVNALESVFARIRSAWICPENEALEILFARIKKDLSNCGDGFEQVGREIKKEIENLKAVDNGVQPHAQAAFGNGRHWSNEMGTYAMSGAVERLVSDMRTPDDITADIAQRYQTLMDWDSRSYSGKCGVFTLDQLVEQGIVKKGVDPQPASGKDYYRVWSGRTSTSTGFSVESVAGTNALRELVNKHGNSPIQNIALSFDYDGKNYLSEHGHVMLISEIRDGKVYYMESASGSLYNLDQRSYVEGEPICLTLDDFLKQYPGMNGVVHFYK